MNPAQRLLKIYDKLVDQANDLSMVEVWSRVFELDNAPNLEDNVIACVVALRREIDFTAAKLKELGVPSDLLHPGFSRLKDTSSPSHLNASWNGIRGNIQSPECRQAFMWSTWVLSGFEEKEISDAELKELLNEIASLEKALDGTEMPQLLRDFIQQQIDSIKSALLISEIQGSRPIHDAIDKFAGAYSVNRNDIDIAVKESSKATKSVFSKLGGLLFKVAEAGDAADKLKKLAENVGAGVGVAKPLLLEILSKFN